MPFVLDNAVVTGWYIEDQASDYTRSIAKRLETECAFVPALWQLEFANVLKTACTRGRLPVEVAREIAITIASLPIEVDPDTPGPREMFELAVRHALSSYDAAYLELALRRGLPLACRDGRLRDAALAAGVAIL